MQVYTYVTDPKTDTVHLLPEAEWFRPDGPRVLCGRQIPDGIGGDETMSGIAATCGSCVRIWISNSRKDK